MTLKRILSAPGVIAHTSATVTGTGVYKGKTYHWEFNPMFGPSFTDAEGEILDRQPGTRSHAWKAWEAWFDELNADTDAAREMATYNEWVAKQAKERR